MADKKTAFGSSSSAMPPALASQFSQSATGFGAAEKCKYTTNNARCVSKSIGGTHFCGLHKDYSLLVIPNYMHEHVISMIGLMKVKKAFENIGAVPDDAVEIFGKIDELFRISNKKRKSESDDLPEAKRKSPL